MTESTAIRLVFVDDDERLLETLGEILTEQPDFHVVGCYASAEEALEEVNWTGVDVLLSDLSLPGASGEDLISAAKSRHPELHAVAYTVHDDRQSLFNALRAGAESYIIKGLPVAETIQSIKGASQGMPMLSPPVARFLIEDFHSRAPDSADALSAREIDLLQLSAEGLIYKEIGDRLGISPGTVHSHIKRIYRKLQVGSRGHALRRAEELGYLKPKPAADGGAPATDPARLG